MGSWPKTFSSNYLRGFKSSIHHENKFVYIRKYVIQNPVVILKSERTSNIHLCTKLKLFQVNPLWVFGKEEVVDPKVKKKMFNPNFNVFLVTDFLVCLVNIFVQSYIFSFFYQILKEQFFLWILIWAAVAGHQRSTNQIPSLKFWSK